MNDLSLKDGQLADAELPAQLGDLCGLLFHEREELVHLVRLVLLPLLGAVQPVRAGDPLLDADTYLHRLELHPLVDEGFRRVGNRPVPGVEFTGQLADDPPSGGDDIAGVADDLVDDLEVTLKLGALDFPVGVVSYFLLVLLADLGNPLLGDPLIVSDLLEGFAARDPLDDADVPVNKRKILAPADTTTPPLEKT